MDWHLASILCSFSLHFRCTQRQESSWCLPMWTLAVLNAFGLEKCTLAGCLFSVSFTRMFLYAMLEELTKQHPAVTISAWVDQIVMYCVGKSAPALARCAGQAFPDFHQSSSDSGLAISSKSTVLATPGLKHPLEQELANRSLPLTVGKTGEDLGVDANLSQVRLTPVANNCLNKAVGQRAKVQQLLSDHRAADKQVMSTGFWTKASWGYQACSASPHHQSPV